MMMMSSPDSSWNQSSSVRDEPVKTIRVIAPATLEQDFTFDVTLGGKHGNRPYTVTVPEGGVLEGEEFDIPYPSWDEYSDVVSTDEHDHHEVKRSGEVKRTYSDDKKTLPCDSNSQNENDDDAVVVAAAVAAADYETNAGVSDTDTATGAPMGRWRNHLLSCCDVVTQSTFWMAIFCIPVMIAQLVSRLNLSYKGVPTLVAVNNNIHRPKAAMTTTQTVFEDAMEEASLSYNKIVLSFVAVLCITNVLPAVGLLLVLIYTALLMVYVGSNIRRSMRRKYNIPLTLPFLQTLRRCFCRPLPKRGVKMSKKRRSVKVQNADEEAGGYVEDFLCMFLCGCCSLIQMGRHTHDDKEYPGYCCTTTGLEVGAPTIV
jgi:hypothetical protein